MQHLKHFQAMNLPIPGFADKFVRKRMLDLQAHDEETYNHCNRVSSLALGVAQEMGLNRLEQAIAAYSGLLHDLGKMLIPTSILNKPGRLDASEYEIMKKHAQYSYDLLEPLESVPFFKKVREAVLYHHERMDGQGYFALEADKIPFFSRIILVVDTVDAMTQDRAYRKGASLDGACEELLRCSGTQFDPQVVESFLAAYGDKKTKAA